MSFSLSKPILNLGGYKGHVNYPEHMKCLMPSVGSFHRN